MTHTSPFDRMFTHPEASRWILLFAMPLPVFPLLSFFRLVSDRVRALSYILCSDMFMSFSTVTSTKMMAQYTTHVAMVVGKYCKRKRIQCCAIEENGLEQLASERFTLLVFCLSHFVVVAIKNSQRRKK